MENTGPRRCCGGVWSWTLWIRLLWLQTGSSKEEKKEATGAKHHGLHVYGVVKSPLTSPANPGPIAKQTNNTQIHHFLLLYIQTVQVKKITKCTNCTKIQCTFSSLENSTKLLFLTCWVHIKNSKTCKTSTSPLLYILNLSDRAFAHHNTQPFTVYHYRCIRVCFFVLSDKPKIKNVHNCSFWDLQWRANTWDGKINCSMCIVYCVIAKKLKCCKLKSTLCIRVLLSYIHPVKDCKQVDAYIV